MIEFVGAVVILAFGVFLGRWSKSNSSTAKAVVADVTTVAKAVDPKL
jgi:hypothetical protein